MPVSQTKEEVSKCFDVAWEKYDANLAGNLDSALFYMREIESISTSVGDKEWQVAAYYGIGEIKLKQRMFDEAIHYYLKAIDGYKELGDLAQLSNVYISVGTIYERQKSFRQAIEYNIKAKDILIYEGSSSDKAKVLRNLAVYHYEIEELEEAEEYLLEAEEICLSSQNFYRLSLVYNMFGMLHLKQENFPEAQKYFLKAVHFSDSVANGEWQKSLALHNLGESYFLAGNISESKVWLQEAIAAKIKFGDPVLAQSSYNLLAQILLKDSQPEKAVAILEEGLQKIDPDVVDNTINESLMIINQALLEMNEEADPSEYPYLNKKLATYSGKLLAYNTRVSDLQENLETISQQQSVQAAVERYAFYEQLEASEAKQKKLGYAFLVPVLLLLAALVAIYMVFRRNRHYKELYSKVEQVLNNSKALRHLK